MTDVRLARFRALPEAEARVLLLISAFSGTPDNPRALEGRVKLAKKFAEMLGGELAVLTKERPAHSRASGPASALGRTRP